MRQFLSKVFLVAFIFVFAIPAPLLAQNWTPPTQPAVGGNTPSPINVSEFAQTKRGRLTVDGEGSNTSLPGLTSRSSSLLRGTSVFDVGDMLGGSPGPNMMLSWVKSYFMSNVTVGSQGTVGPEIRLNGQLYYKPLALDGTISGNQPAQGALLSIIDANGKVGYTPVPANDGDTLIWDSTCNCWITGPGGGNGTTTPSGLPVGVFGQTTWYNASNAMEATSQITHGFDSDGTTTLTRIPNKNIYVGSAGLGKTTILSPITDISGTNSVNIGIATTGQTTVNSPQVTFVENPSPNFTQTVDFQSRYVNLKAPGVGSQILGVASNTVNFDDGAGQIANYQTVNVKSGNVNVVSPTVSFQDANGQTSDYQTVNVKSGNVNFASPDDGGYQTVTFESDAVKLKNINMNPGVGRIPYAMNDEGRFGWNENLTYQLNQGGFFPEPVGQLTLHNPGGGTALFQNQGLSQLMDDVYIEDTGHLYLYGINSAAPNQRGVGIIKPLCYITTTKKVVNCNDTPLTNNPVGSQVEPAYDTDYEIFRTSEHNSGPLSTYIFQSSQTVDIKFCGGGGGGGGGGAGASGHGGGAGGGGAAGNCQTFESFSVSPGDVLSWDIGEGGNGGNGTKRQDFSSGSSTSQLASNGLSGQPTSLFIDYISDSLGNPVQLGQTQSGGLGGERGIGDIVATPNGSNISTTTGGFLGGLGANNNIAAFHDGQNGCGGFTVVSGIQNCQGSPIGGYGGDGENPVGSILPTTPSAGGNPGINDWADNVTSDHWNNRTGGPGYEGNPGNGGGGGAGGFGSSPYTNQDAGVNPLIYMWTKWPGGGNGGQGGSGYVQVGGILNSQVADSVEFNTPSSTDVPFQVSALPSGVQNFTIEVWSGAGGGGGVKTGFLADRHASGGGGGGYIKIPDVPRSQLGTTLLVRVGAGGVAGISSGSAGDVTNGAVGGTSYIKISGSPTNIAHASGGAGGVKDTDNDSQTVPGAVGGQPGSSAPFSALPGIIMSQGTNGTTNAGGNNLQGGNISAGGVGADTNLVGGTSTNSSAGQNGKVKISW